MAANLSIPLQSYAAQTFTSPAIDTIPGNAVGAKATFTRGAAGTWPGTSSDLVLTLLVEFRIDGVWQPAAQATYNGGQSLLKDGSVRLADYLAIQFPKENINGVLKTMVPDALRVKVTTAQTLSSAVSLQWL